MRVALIPFAGYQSGLDGAFGSLFAVVAYGVYMGGFVVLAAMGAAFGALAAWLGKGDTNKGKPMRRNTLVGILAGFSAALIAVGLLANWDAFASMIAPG